MRYVLSKDNLREAFQVSGSDGHRDKIALDTFSQAMAEVFCSTWAVYPQVGSAVGHVASRVNEDVPEMAQVTDFSLAIMESLIGAIMDSYFEQLGWLPYEKIKSMSQSLIAMLGEVFENGKPDAAYMEAYVACCRCSSLAHPFSAAKVEDWVKSTASSDSNSWDIVLIEAEQARAQQKPDTDAPMATEDILRKLVEVGFLINHTLLMTLSRLSANLPGETPLSEAARYADSIENIKRGDSLEYRLRHYAEAQRIIDDVLAREGLR